MSVKLDDVTVINWLAISVRVVVALNLVLSRNLVAIIFGLSELLSVAFSMVNESDRQDCERRPLLKLLPLVYCVGMVIKPEQTTPAAWYVYAALVLGVGSIVLRLMFGKRYSCGVATAVEDEPKQDGPWGIVRHPIQAWHLLGRINFLLANFSAWNAVVTVVAVLSSATAALMEESFWRQRGPNYARYAEKTRWRFCPGVW